MAAVLTRYARPLQLIMALVLALLAVWAMRVEIPRVIPEHGLWDFGAFVASGRAAAAGLDPYGIYPPLTPHVVFPGFESWNPNLNPPISALLFQAFDLADPAQSFRIWRWISIGCYAAAVLLLLRRYADGPQALLLGVWAAGLAGFWDTLYLGQIYTPLVLFAVIAWLQLERGNMVVAGIMIGLLVSMKPNFLVWPVLLFLAGYRLPALVTVATAALVALVPLLVFGPQIYIDWLQLVASDGERAVFLTNASFSGLAARAGIPLLGTIAGGILLLALAAWAFRRKPAIIEIGSFGLLAALLASPLGWIQYTLFLLPVLLHYRHTAWAFGAALLLTIPVPFVLSHFGASTAVQLTIGSIYGWALVLLLAGLIVQAWKRPDVAAIGDQGSRR